MRGRGQGSGAHHLEAHHLGAYRRSSAAVFWWMRRSPRTSNRTRSSSVPAPHRRARSAARPVAAATGTARPRAPGARRRARTNAPCCAPRARERDALPLARNVGIDRVDRAVRRRCDARPACRRDRPERCAPSRCRRETIPRARARGCPRRRRAAARARTEPTAGARRVAFVEEIHDFAPHRRRAGDARHVVHRRAREIARPTRRPCSAPCSRSPSCRACPCSCRSSRSRA